MKDHDVHDPARPPTALLGALRHAVGGGHVLTGDAETHRFRTGYRFGTGPALAVVRPGSLIELWRVAQAVVEAGAILIPQASNTGLTGGSTPDGDGYDRPVVIVSMRRIAGVHLVRGGAQVVCLPGATLDVLEKTLAPLGREPHSVIGSSCIGASVLGGVCNTSGGALVRRGPAFTELALYARVDADGRLELVNHLGVELGDTPEEILMRLERGDFAEVQEGGRASDHDYARHVRAIDADTPARFNADPGRLFEASGSAGHVVVFAVRLDTFPKEAGTEVFYIGSNDPADLTRLRREMLAGDLPLPIAGEYLHRDAFVLTERYGRDTFLAIRYLGTARLPALFRWKDRVDGWFRRLGLRDVADKALQAATRLGPSHLPKRLTDYRDRFEHHLMLRVASADTTATEALLAHVLGEGRGAFFRCDKAEGDAAFMHRFAAAGAAVRYRAVHAREVADIVALDIALRRNDTDWFETLPPELDAAIAHTFYYGHFFCHVFHQDYVIRKGHDPLAIEHRMWALLDARGAEYPAEHNVGHLYPAKPALAAHYRALDPTNSFNPGIGQTSKRAHWG
ncbi:D-lactate dehydrogenase [Sphingomonas panacis]|uniref:Quinone-dependent D-lactate dehydrogenase n=2 Tax=Sphingomonas panacis TaxID=1560345 RepID=A0A1B3ZH85_9SPHN|nr:D-lactate dehydrogenase [Sphingomonas panacis]AOH86751.1 D-lactate dehydrogenase [Sphingomonas panacis]